MNLDCRMAAPAGGEMRASHSNIIAWIFKKSSSGGRNEGGGEKERRAEEKRNAAQRRKGMPPSYAKTDLVMTNNRTFGVDFGMNLVIILMDINLH